MIGKFYTYVVFYFEQIIENAIFIIKKNRKFDLESIA